MRTWCEVRNFASQISLDTGTMCIFLA